MAGGAGGCMASSLPEASPAGLLLVRPCSLYFLAAAIRAAMPLSGASDSDPGASDAHSLKGRLRLLGGRRLHVKLEGALSDLILWPRLV